MPALAAVLAGAATRSAGGGDGLQALAALLALAFSLALARSQLPAAASPNLPGDTE